MARPQKSRESVITRDRGQDLARTPEEAAALKLILLNTLEEITHRVGMGEKPPAYLLKALLRFDKERMSWYLRSAAVNAVKQAVEAGHPLSRGSRSLSGAFAVAAERLSDASGQLITERWVEDVWLKAADEDGNTET